MFSPADYAAYSRATGRPYPQDEQERADMYGEVREFRNNQMKRDEGPGLAAGLLGGAAVLGTIAGGAVAGRRFLNNSRRGGVKKQDLPLSSEGMSATRRVTEPAEINDVAAAGQKMPSNPVSDSIVQDNADAGEGFKRFSRRADEIGEQASEIQAQNLADSTVETMVNIQQKREPVVSQQSLEATDTAFDQKVQDLQASVQRNEDLDVGSIDFDAVARQSIRDQGEAIDLPVQGPVAAQEMADDVKSKIMALRSGSEGTITTKSGKTRSVPSSRLRAERELGENYSEDVLKQLNQEFPEEAGGVNVVDNVRQRRELGSPDDPFASRETIDSVLTGSDSPVDTNMRGRALRGGLIDAAGDIKYQDASGQDFYSADTGVKASQSRGTKYEERARLNNQLNRASDDELASLVNLSSDPDALYDARQRGRMASDILRQRAVANMDAGRDVSAQQAMALSRGRQSVDASEKIKKQKTSRPAATTGPEADVARSMETMRRGMEVEPSELPPVISDVTTAFGDEKGEVVGAISAPTAYTGAAREAAGPVLFTGKSRAESVVRGPERTGSVDTPTGRYATVDNPDRIGTVFNVAGTPENRAKFATIEQNAQDFLADAISGGLTARANPGVEAPSSKARIQLIGPLEAGDARVQTYPQAENYPLPQIGVGLPGIEPSKRTNYARYQMTGPYRSKSTPISPFIGEMSGGTVEPSNEFTGLPRTDIGRTTPSARPGSSRDLEEAQRQSYPPIGPLTQSPGLPRVTNVSETPFVRKYGTSQGQQRTAQGFPIQYPRMMKVNTANRPAWQLMSPMRLTNRATGETQTVNIGAGPLRTYQM